MPASCATAGVHPHEAQHGIDGLAELLDDPMVVAVGECGLDFHYDHSPRDAQRAVFADQIALAHAHDLPLVIHTRSAWPETFDLLAAEGMPERTVFHCFTGGPDEARRCLDLGAHLSFSRDRRRSSPPTTCAPPPRSARSTGCWSRPTRPTSRRSRTAARPTARRSCPSSAPASPRPAGTTSEVVADATWRNAAAFYGLDERLAG